MVHIEQDELRIEKYPQKMKFEISSYSSTIHNQK